MGRAASWKKMPIREEEDYEKTRKSPADTAMGV